ncbi:hypothetical protein ACWDBW_46805 [Streptomyces sp. NPDC001107]
MGELLVVPGAAQAALRVAAQGGVFVVTDGVPDGSGEDVGVVEGEVHALPPMGETMWAASPTR